MNAKSSPKDFFLQIAAFAALYVSVISILTLLFQYINILFPDEINRYIDPFSGSIRFAIASLIIVFPLYIFFTRLVNKDLREHKEKREGRLHKWLIYITLFIAGVTIAGDLIALINTFLGGELTIRFILKVLSILVVVGAAFGYYFSDLRGVWNRDEKSSKNIGWGASVLVLIIIIGGFFIIGSPNTQRELRLDQERVQDLQNIQFQIVEYWRDTEGLPSTLGELTDPLIGFTVPTPPGDEDSYGYDRTGEKTFELCAVFSQPTSTHLRGEAIVIKEPFGLFDSNWEHEAGETCFERTIDPDRIIPTRIER